MVRTQPHPRRSRTIEIGIYPKNERARAFPCDRLPYPISAHYVPKEFVQQPVALFVHLSMPPQKIAYILGCETKILSCQEIHVSDLWRDVQLP